LDFLKLRLDLMGLPFVTKCDLPFSDSSSSSGQADKWVTPMPPMSGRCWQPEVGLGD